MFLLRRRLLTLLVVIVLGLTGCGTGGAQPPGTRPPVTVQPGSPMTGDAVADAIQTYARQVLGLQVQVEAAQGRTGTVTFPELARQGMEVAVQMAGATSTGLLSDPDGLASVSLGEGAVSGDLQADIDSASLGAFVFSQAGPIPADEGAALALVRAAFPGLGDLDYVAQPTQGRGYAFKAVSSTKGLNLKAGQIEAGGQAVLAGVAPGLRQDRVLVWVVVGRGAFSSLI